MNIEKLINELTELRSRGETDVVVGYWVKDSFTCNSFFEPKESEEIKDNWPYYSNRIEEDFDWSQTNDRMNDMVKEFTSDELDLKYIAEDEAVGEQCTQVFFVKDTSESFKGDITAIFPLIEGTIDSHDWTCYAHVGQHSVCTPEWVEEQESASPEEYEDLKNELVRQGYNDLQVINESLSNFVHYSDDVNEHRDEEAVVYSLKEIKANIRLISDVFSYFHIDGTLYVDENGDWK